VVIPHDRLIGKAMLNISARGGDLHGLKKIIEASQKDCYREYIMALLCLLKPVTLKSMSMINLR
jgi:hypothetical protein